MEACGTWWKSTAKVWKTGNWHKHNVYRADHEREIKTDNRTVSERFLFEVISESVSCRHGFLQNPTSRKNDVHLRGLCVT